MVIYIALFDTSIIVSRVIITPIKGIQPLNNTMNLLRNMTMKSIKTLFAVAALSLVSFGSFAQTVTATSTTLDGAEAQIASQAKEQGASYKITEAYAGNQVHMTAELTK